MDSWIEWLEWLKNHSTRGRSSKLVNAPLRRDEVSVPPGHQAFQTPKEATALGMSSAAGFGSPGFEPVIYSWWMSFYPIWRTSTLWRLEVFLAFDLITVTQLVNALKEKLRGPLGCLFRSKANEALGKFPLRALSQGLREQVTTFTDGNPTSASTSCIVGTPTTVNRSGCNQWRVVMMVAMLTAAGEGIGRRARSSRSAGARSRKTRAVVARDGLSAAIYQELLTMERFISGTLSYRSWATQLLQVDSSSGVTGELTQDQCARDVHWARTLAVGQEKGSW